MKNFKTLTISLCCTLALLSGCQSYFDRHDGVTRHAGDSQAANELKMVEDPWRRKAYNTHQHTDSERISRAVENYRAGTNGETAGSESPIALATGG